jgi:Xaa-Pro aminopeptidase
MVAQSNQLAPWQERIGEAGLDGWLIADFRWNNPLFARLLDLQSGILTRRSFLWLPRAGAGEPRVLVSATDGHTLSGLPYAVTAYRSYDAMTDALREMLPSGSRVAMEYTPFGTLPTVSRVDAGLVELIRSLGVEVVSSGGLVAALEVWSDRQMEQHRRAARGVDEARRVALQRATESLLAGERVTEGSVARTILRVFEDLGLAANSDPDVGVGPHAADPHYSLAPGDDGAEVVRGEVLLIDLWCKLPGEPTAPFADSTWMAFVGANPPSDIQAAFGAVATARRAAVEAVDASTRAGRSITGREADAAARAVLIAAGYGDQIVHRTGHSLGIDHVHGVGTNLDSVEFPDDRSLLPGSGFTVEPGIYFPGRFGMRSEVSAILRPDHVDVTTESQNTLTVLDV